MKKEVKGRGIYLKTQDIQDHLFPDSISSSVELRLLLFKENAASSCCPACRFTISVPAACTFCAFVSWTVSVLA